MFTVVATEQRAQHLAPEKNALPSGSRSGADIIQRQTPALLVITRASDLMSGPSACQRHDTVYDTEMCIFNIDFVPQGAANRDAFPLNRSVA